ncbi:hypothetical protein LBMAG25_06330 [Bacteroidota bacterium]|nr:hypothetical protein LBMAG25_06330 [Bacteroidota bacterium]
MNSEQLYPYILFAHILSGGASLMAGLVALTTTKGRRLHKVSGKTYLGFMLLAVIAALVMCSLKPNSFLFSIGVFTLYMMFTGWRALHNRKFIALWFDWVACIAAMITGAWMIAQLEIVLIIFGSITVLMGLQDYILFYRSRSIPPKKVNWLQMHIGRMTGSYIATTTAFLVVNVQIKPYWVPWLLPTVLGSLVIAYFMRRYTMKTKH